MMGGKTPSMAGETPWPIAHGQRPSFRLSDVWRVPSHDFLRQPTLIEKLVPSGPRPGSTGFQSREESATNRAVIIVREWKAARCVGPKAESSLMLNEVDGLVVKQRQRRLQFPFCRHRM
jgi:hypothetical protein